MAANYREPFAELDENFILDQHIRITQYDYNKLAEVKKIATIFNILGIDDSLIKRVNINRAIQQGIERLQRYDYMVYNIDCWLSSVNEKVDKELKDYLVRYLSRIFKGIFKKITMPTDITTTPSEKTIKSKYLYKIYLDQEAIAELLNPSESQADKIKKDILKRREENKDMSLFTFSIADVIRCYGLITKFPNTFYLHRNKGLYSGNLQGNLYVLRVREGLSLPEQIFAEVKINSGTEAIPEQSTAANSESWLLRQHFGKFPGLNDYNFIPNYADTIQKFFDSADSVITTASTMVDMGRQIQKLLESIKSEENLSNGTKSFGEHIILYDLRHFSEYTFNTPYWNVIRKYGVLNNMDSEFDLSNDEEQ